MQYNYTNKTVFMGIDVHKKSYSIACVCEQMIVKQWSMVASKEKLIEQIKKYFKGAKIESCYEAGFSGFGLHRALINSEINNKVINASSVEIAANDRVKTDKRDAKKLALQLSQGRLNGINVPTVQQEQNRLLSRHRASLVKDRTRLVLQIKSKLFQFDCLPYDQSPYACKSWINKLLLQDFPTEVKYVISELANRWLFINSEIKKIELQLKKQADVDSYEIIYRSAPGLGAVSSRVLSNELRDLSQFNNEKQLFSFTGLTPSEHSSGEKRILGRITHCGPSRVRFILIEAAWRAIREDKVLCDFFNKLSHRAGKQKAIVAVARKLIGHLRGCFATGELYRTSVVET